MATDEAFRAVAVVRPVFSYLLVNKSNNLIYL
jgi:hypothetical protein